jgi:hypothetical protein
VIGRPDLGAPWLRCNHDIVAAAAIVTAVTGTAAAVEGHQQGKAAERAADSAARKAERASAADRAAMAAQEKKLDDAKAQEAARKRQRLLASNASATGTGRTPTMLTGPSAPDGRKTLLGE